MSFRGTNHADRIIPFTVDFYYYYSNAEECLSLTTGSQRHSGEAFPECLFEFHKPQMHREWTAIQENVYRDEEEAVAALKHSWNEHISSSCTQLIYIMRKQL